MRRTYTLSFLGKGNLDFRQVSISSRLVILGAGMLLVGLAFLPFLASKYCQLKQQKISNGTAMHHFLESGTHVIQQQNSQLEYFEAEIQKMNTALAQLQQAEQTIRGIANIGPAHSENGIFGIGGSIGGESEPPYFFPQMVQRGGMPSAPSSVPEKMNHGLQPEEIVKALDNRLGKNRNLLSSTPIIYPAIGWETSGFGYRRSLFTGKKEFHKGLDLAATVGTPVVAPANGIITDIGSRGVWGLTLVVDHGHGLVTRYSHLSAVEKKEGDSVSRGEIIASVGSSGRCNGPHLHYEVRLNGIPVNPKSYVMFAPFYIYEAFKKESERNFTRPIEKAGA